MMQYERIDRRQLATFALFTPDCGRQTPQGPVGTNRRVGQKPSPRARAKSPRDRRFLDG